MTPRIKAGGQWISPDEVASLPDGLSSSEKGALQFCDAWMRGQQEFEFETSGSTGPPKKIHFKRNQLIDSARLSAAALQLRPGEKALVCLDTKFIAGAMMLVRSLVVGMDMILKAPSADPLDGVADQIDFAAFVPLQLRTLLRDHAGEFNKIRVAIIGGGPVPPDLLDKLQGLKTSVFATYGMTETITHVALQKLNGPGKEDSFRLLPGVTASHDDRGCLVLQAPHLGAVPVITNDIINFVDATHFTWEGRFDQVINSGGIKIQIEKIEQQVLTVLQKLDIQTRFFIAGLPDKNTGEQVALILEGESSAKDRERIKNELASHLTKYEIPKVILSTPRFVETQTQKIDRRKTLLLLPGDVGGMNPL